MKGVILYKEDTYYTYLKRIFEAINNRQKEYNWLISDCVCYPANINYERLMNRDYTWISGEDLTDMINKVLSNFEKAEDLGEYNKQFL